MNYDEQPVGHSKKLEIDELPPGANPSETAPPIDKNIPLSERVVNKNSKIRLEGMNELLKLFTESEKENSCFKEYYPKFPKYLSDSHPGVQEKATEAFLVMLNKSPISPDDILKECINTLIEKGLTSTKSQCKTKSLESLIVLSGIPAILPLIKESLTQNLSPKTAPKLSSVSINALTQLLINYGNTYYPVKDSATLISVLAGSTNAQVRTEALNYLKEGYKWDKGTITKTIETLRQVQQDELKKQFSTITEPPKPLRLSKVSPVDSLSPKVKEEQKVDPYTKAAEVSVLKKYNDAWCNQTMATKKWSDRKARLEELLTAISVPRIKNEPFYELWQTIKKLLVDSNILVSNTTVKIVGQLAKGLRLHFASYAKSSFELVVQKFKDKKSSEVAQKCLEDMIFSLKLDDMIEIIKETLQDKSPLIKLKVCQWLDQTVFNKLNTSTNAVNLWKNYVNNIGPILVKLTDDASSDVRECALNCFGTMKRFIGEDSQLNKIIAEMNSQKREKIEKLAEQYKKSEEEKNLKNDLIEIKQENVNEINPFEIKMEKEQKAENNNNLAQNEEIKPKIEPTKPVEKIEEIKPKIEPIKPVEKIEEIKPIQEEKKNGFIEAESPIISQAAQKIGEIPIKNSEQTAKIEENKQKSVKIEENLNKPLENKQNESKIEENVNKQKQEEIITAKEEKPIQLQENKNLREPKKEHKIMCSINDSIPLKTEEKKLPINDMQPTIKSENNNIQENTEISKKETEVLLIPKPETPISNIQKAENPTPEIQKSENPIPKPVQEISQQNNILSNPNPIREDAKEISSPINQKEELKSFKEIPRSPVQAPISSDKQDSIKSPIKNAKPRPETARPKKESKQSASEIKEIPEENLGTFCSIEDSTKIVLENIPDSVAKLLDNGDWKERQKGLQDLNEWIKGNNEKTQNILEQLTIWLKSKLKDFKESNQGIIKELLTLLSNISANLVVNKKFAHEVLPSICEKLNDLKLIGTVNEIILHISDCATPQYVATKCINCGYATKAINTIKGILSLLNKMLDAYGPGLLPLKHIIDFSKHCLLHANPQVRNSATNAIVATYSLAGDLIKPWLANELKDPAYKNLEAELNKIQPQKISEQYEIKRTLRGEAAAEYEKSKKKDIADSLAPRVNISTQLTSKLISGLSDTSMKHRQESKDAIEKILAVANNRILPTGLSQLIIALKGRMGEPCKNLAKSFITLVGNLAAALGQGFRQYSKIIVQPLMYNLADKQATIRSETALAMDKISDAAGSDLILNNAGPLLEKDNPDVRTMLLTWILKHKDSIGHCDVKALAGPLVNVMQDRSKEIRALGEQVVGEVINVTGSNVFNSIIQDLKPVVKSMLSGIFDKFKNNAPQKPIENENIPPITEIKEEIKKTEEITKPLESQRIDMSHIERDKTPDKQIPSSTKVSPWKKPPLDKSAKNLKEVKKNVPPAPEMTSSKSAVDLVKQKDVTPRHANIKEVKKISKPLTKDTKFKAGSQSPSKSQVSGTSNNTLYVETIVMQCLGNKEKRAEQDKTMKWPVNEIREDYVEKLKKQLKIALHPNLFDAMFSTQFKKNLASANALTDGLKNEFTSMLDIFDLLCKWVVIKMVDQTNTAMTKSLLEFVQLFFNKMESTKYQMLDFEAASIVPMLCERTSISNNGFKQQIKDLLKQATQIYSIPKIVGYLMNTIELTKNQKTKAECLPILKEFITKCGAKVFMPKDIKLFVKLVLSPDNGIKAECLDLLCEIYKARGEAIWGLTGEVPEKVKEIMKKHFANLTQNPNEHPLSQTFRGDKRPMTPNVNMLENNMPLSNQMTVTMDGREKTDMNDQVTEISPAIPNMHNISSIVTSPLPAASQLITENSTSAFTIPNVEEQEKKGQENDGRMSLNNIEKNEKNELTGKMSEMKFGETNKIILDSTYKLEDEFSHTSSKLLFSATKVQDSTPRRTKIQDGEGIKIETLDQALSILKSGDISRRVDALMFLNEKASSVLDKEKEALILHGDQLFTAFSEVLKEIFDKAIHDIPIRFAKYFMTVINKICMNRSVLRGISEKPVLLFAEQLLTKLLFDNLDKMGDNNEGEYLVKAFNSTMLKMLENCNPTNTFVALIELFRLHKNAEPVTGAVKTGKLPSLIIKCILKLTKVMEALIPNLNISRLLIALHEYMLVNPSNVPKTANDDIGIRIIKTIINDLVKIRGELIWEDYKAIEAHDKLDTHIKRWINIILKSSHPGASDYATVGSTRKETPLSTPTNAESSDELKEIFKGLNSQTTFHDAIRSLSEYLARHPQFDLSQYFVSCSKGFREYVMASLQKYNSQLTFPQPSLLTEKDMLITSPRSLKDTPAQPMNPTPSSSSSAEYKAKMAILRQKFGMVGKDAHKANNGTNV